MPRNTATDTMMGGTYAWRTKTTVKLRETSGGQELQSIWDCKWNVTGLGCVLIQDESHVVKTLKGHVHPAMTLGVCGNVRNRDHNLIGTLWVGTQPHSHNTTPS